MAARAFNPSIFARDGERRFVVPARLGSEAAEHDPVYRGRFIECRNHSAQCDLRGIARRKAISPGGDGGVGDGEETVIQRDRQATAIAGGKQPVLAALAPASDRSDGVNYVARR